MVVVVVVVVDERSINLIASVVASSWPFLGIAENNKHPLVVRMKSAALQVPAVYASQFSIHAWTEIADVEARKI